LFCFLSCLICSAAAEGDAEDGSGIGHGFPASAGLASFLILARILLLEDRRENETGARGRQHDDGA